MQALGLIETKGLIAAIESSDVMLKASEVDLVSKEIVGGGLVTVTVTGDVGAVKAAVDAGASAVNQLGEEFLISQHVIARPDSEIDKLFKHQKANPIPEESIEEIIPEEKSLNETETKVANAKFNQEVLEAKRINELRQTVRSIKSLNISDSDLQKMTKKQIITEILNSDKEG